MTKLKLDYQEKKILSVNLPYLVIFLILNLILLGFILFNVNQFLTNVQKIDSLDSEIAEYIAKKDILDFKNQIIEGEVDLDYVNQIFTQLVPIKEDYFSILSALERLSVETNFIITSYNFNVAESTPEKLAFVIEGQGSPNDFLRFLEEYNFSGGRLITIDKIDFTQEAFTGAKVNIKVYAGKAQANSKTLSKSEVDTFLIRRILEKVELNLQSQPTQFEDYSTKSNPF
ncbi:hypothetical protein A2774_01330 [Candidatus Roizmanbacteria bacterium RIFCSPHIGHO2_01_FULL_39_12c]|uniref:Uncharacterized protein n=1 Tax=Candidatus Roizmanbacteria bacterium RIFCSPHIGHO2_01_FULL_39_12c TaxID=1802031 RepID=A0A1F7GF13_9BACT|nr:MAG: hypothetical protein A2774_01330 [Candidatus Roizmanbacteria bacterium RIFCSPHIGHO2_01_FULL_39_12c]OGK47516.1 MAG: hypothetical protein A2963_01335 [Candidatus Roizmanbacteria bacterium RIFCSPLOWO2_01_FULL_40_13]